MEERKIRSNAIIANSGPPSFGKSLRQDKTPSFNPIICGSSDNHGKSFFNGLMANRYVAEGKKVLYYPKPHIGKKQLGDMLKNSPAKSCIIIEGFDTSLIRQVGMQPHLSTKIIKRIIRKKQCLTI